MSGHIELDVKDSVARITIESPGKHNAMSHSMWQSLNGVLNEIAHNDRLRCVVLRGAGDLAFSSGGDIDEFESLRSSKSLAKSFGHACHQAMHAVHSCAIPTVAAIRGICVGGGLELAAHCDLRIASEGSKFGIPIAKLGAVLAYPELLGLVRLVGETTAAEMLLEGRVFGAHEALQKRLVNRVISESEFDAEVEKTIDRIISNAPLSARTHKRFLARLRPHRLILEEAELEEGYECFDTQDFRIGYQSFLTKTKPVFEGR